MELTRAERRRLEKLVGKKPVYYQYTLEQIEEIRQQAIQDKKRRDPEGNECLCAEKVGFHGGRTGRKE